jgi:hypothetical protein
VDKVEFLPAFMQARQQAFSSKNIQSGFTATGLNPFDPEQVLSGLQIRQKTPEATPPQLYPETPHDINQLERQFQLIKGYLRRRSKSPPSPTDTAINQLVKGCQLAMHGAVLLADENERLRAMNERQTKKRAVRKKQISKATTLTVAEAQSLIQNTKQGSIQTSVKPNKVVAPAEALLSSALSQANRFGLPSCFICTGFDHLASECSKYR